MARRGVWLAAAFFLLLGAGVLLFDLLGDFAGPSRVNLPALASDSVERTNPAGAGLELQASGRQGREVPAGSAVPSLSTCEPSVAPPADDIDKELSSRDLSGESWNGPWMQFDSAEKCANDRHFNPGRIQLAPEECRRLSDLVDRLNAKLRAAQDRIDATAQSHIDDKINAGQAQILPDGARPDWKALGAGGLPMGRSSDGVSYYMKFFEGEFSDLDEAMYQHSALTKIGEQRISGFFR